MSLAREVNLELEREEDCYKEPATREDTPMTIVEEDNCYEASAAATTTHAYCTVGIVEEEDCCKDYVAKTTTSDYGTVGGDHRSKQRLLDCLEWDVDKEFMRAMVGLYTGAMVRPASPGT